MNKSDFINRLEKALGNIKWEEKKEIIYDYEEYFANAISEGKTEEQAAEELGNPEEIALNYFPNNGEQKNDNSSKADKSSFSNVINNIVKSALNFASQSINDTLNLQKIEVDSISNTEIESAEKLEILKCKSTNVKIIKSDQKNFSGELKGIARTNPERLPCLINKFDDSSKTLTFSIDWKGQKTSTISGEITIVVPENFNGSVRVETVSGDLLTLPENLDSLSFKSVSGELKPEKLFLTNDLVIKTVSGDIKSALVNCKNINYKSVSGDFAAENTCFETCKFDSTSGDIRVTIPSIPDYMKVKTVSGDAKIKLTANAGINMNYKSVSGDLKTDFAFVVENEKRGFGSYKFKGECTGEKAVTIEAKTVSGDLKLHKMEKKDE